MAAHEPVMTAEVLDYLAPQHGGVFVDCTVGLGGHVRALLVGGASRVLGLDRDGESLSVARTALSPWGDRVELVHADFRHLGTILDERGITTIDGALAGSGVGAEVMGHPFEAVAWLANALAERGEGLRAGQLVLCGSLVAVQWVNNFPAEAAIEIAGLGSVSARFA